MMLVSSLPCVYSDIDARTMTFSVAYHDLREQELDVLHSLEQEVLRSHCGGPRHEVLEDAHARVDAFAPRLLSRNNRPEAESQSSKSFFSTLDSTVCRVQQHSSAVRIGGGRQCTAHREPKGSRRQLESRNSPLSASFGELRYVLHVEVYGSTCAKAYSKEYSQIMITVFL